MRAATPGLPTRLLANRPGAPPLVIALPDWPADVAEVALSRAADVSDLEALAFRTVVDALAGASRNWLDEIGASVAMPPKRRSPDRARAWLVMHWHRPQVRRSLLLFVAHHALDAAAVDAVRLAGVADEAREVATIATRFLRLGAGDARSAMLVYLILRMSRRACERDGAEIFARDPKVRKALDEALAARRADGSLAQDKAVIAALEAVAETRSEAAVRLVPEVRIPLLEHELAEASARIRLLEEALAASEERGRAAQAALGDAVALYEGILSGRAVADAAVAADGVAADSRSGAEAPPVRLPLAGRRVAIAGDPGHAAGYRALAIALGADAAECLDAMTERPTRVAERLAAADVPVLVTAYAKHAVQRAIEDRLAREALVLVPTASLRSMREALVAWASGHGQVADEDSP